jgi:hypothetical protein
MKVGGAVPAVGYKKSAARGGRAGVNEKYFYVLDKSVTRGRPEAANSTESGA